MRAPATLAALAALAASPAGAQEAAPDPAAPAAAPAADPPAPRWIATLAGGVLARDGDAARPFAVAGLSRALGRGYVRVAATGFRAAGSAGDAVLPASFALGSLGAGGTFGSWFVDAAASAGRQFYGGVATPAGTRAAQVGSGSAVWGASLDAGRFVRLARRLYLTPSLAVQYGSQRALAAAPGPAGPPDRASLETAWTGSATLRLDRYFGPDSRHVAGLSVSRVRTGNGALALAAGSGAGAGGAGADGAGPAALLGVPDGWTVAGASASLRAARRLWLDGAATRTLGARSGDYATLSAGVRLGF